MLPGQEQSFGEGWVPERKKRTRPTRARANAGKPRRRMPFRRRKPPDTPSPSIRYCDVVMKGGITSGVVYPMATVELAKVFRFRNIGGTSAGAIAAAYTAAAEHARDGKSGGFDALAALPGWFAESVRRDGKSNLFALFQPAPKIAPFFNVFAATLRGRRNRIGRAVNVADAALSNFPLVALLGSVPGVALAAIAAIDGTGLSFWALVAAAVALGLIGVAVAVLGAMAHIVLRKIPENFYGMCTGYDEAPKSGVPLTNWVAETVDRIAGRDPAAEPPLTFGDLWDGGGGNGHGVNLQMMTTNLTQGRPLRVPFEDPGEKGIGQYYFDPAELRRLFPARLVDWMVDHANLTEVTEKFAPLVPLPLAKDMPVAVGVRLSLAYPVLLSAVPLYTIDWTRDHAKAPPTPERCWFSDGGIASNFPVHFFDQPLPRWPTFAINLRPPHVDLPDDEVWMPRSYRERGVAIWHRFDTGGTPKLFGYLSAVKEVAQNWVDNEQARVPGYRDRVVHIILKRKEGGINLNMPGDAVKDLADRGRRAGRMLADRFATGPKWDVDVNWEAHKWVRFRSTMHVIEEMLREIQQAYRYDRPDERSYEELIRRDWGEPPLEYPWWDEAQRDHAIRTTEALIEIVESWTEPSQTFDAADPLDPGPPEPRPVLRIVPRV